MGERFVTPSTYEQAVELLDMGLLYHNFSYRIPRHIESWVPSTYQNSATHHMEEAFRYGKVSGEGWWKTDYAYRVED